MNEIKFYLDENISPRIASILMMDGIDAVSVRDLRFLGDDDPNHLARATGMERVLCTQDRDYLDLHQSGHNHAGIAFAEQETASFDIWVGRLIELHETYSAEDMVGKVYFVLPPE